MTQIEKYASWNTMIQIAVYTVWQNRIVKTTSFWSAYPSRDNKFNFEIGQVYILAASQL